MLFRAPLTVFKLLNGIILFKFLRFPLNDYGYYEKYHQEMKDKSRKGVTVEEVGGLECQKCHY